MGPEGDVSTDDAGRVVRQEEDVSTDDASRAVGQERDVSTDDAGLRLPRPSMPPCLMIVVHVNNSNFASAGLPTPADLVVRIRALQQQLEYQTGSMGSFHSSQKETPFRSPEIF